SAADGRPPLRRSRILGTRSLDARRFPDAFEGLAMRKKRREPEDLNMQFLDMICCGFGSMILLLMIVKVVEPVVIEKSKVNLQGIIEQRRDAVHEIRGESREMSQSLTELQAMLSRELVQLAQIQRDASRIRGQYAATKSEAEESTALSTKLASAKQSLTEEMEQRLGADVPLSA